MHEAQIRAVGSVQLALDPDPVCVQAVAHSSKRRRRPVDGPGLLRESCARCAQFVAALALAFGGAENADLFV